MINNQTLKAIDRIVVAFAEADPRIRSSRDIGEWKANTKRDDEYPVLLRDFPNNALTMSMKSYVNSNVIQLCLIDQVDEGRSNTTDVISDTYEILKDLAIKIITSNELRNLKITFQNKDLSFNRPQFQGDDRIDGWFVDLEFTVPSVFCVDDLPQMPLSFVDGIYQTSGTSVFCAAVASCPVIVSIQEELAAITGGTGGSQTFVQDGQNTFTGGTPSFPTVNVVNDPSFRNVSGDNFFSGSTNISELFLNSNTLILNDRVQVFIDQPSHGFSPGDLVYRMTGSTIQYGKAIASDPEKAEVVGIVGLGVETDRFPLVTHGYTRTGIALTPGTTYFLSDVTPGLLTDTPPTTTGFIRKAQGVAYDGSFLHYNNQVGYVIPSS